MRFRTLWTALADGEPGIILGTSLLVAALIGVGLLIGRQVVSSRNVTADPDHPTVWQLMRQQPRNHDEWLRQRVEAYRAECHSKTDGCTPDRTAEQAIDDQFIALVNADDWPTVADHAAAVAQSGEMAPHPRHPIAIPGTCRPAGGRVAGRLSTQLQPRARLQRHYCAEYWLQGQIPA
ncbi:hypothetical protein [Amycolatopsis camponoti]|uniref:hypothetical protein n=1 Tax=Amycolatopsis camponoti TaxID=2606593 RepID=UPI0012D77ECF|nr:hypothetical protein [Amycolatopsis camponoti]